MFKAVRVKVKAVVEKVTCHRAMYLGLLLSHVAGGLGLVEHGVVEVAVCVMYAGLWVRG